jgi:putative acetyltransferase
MTRILRTDSDNKDFIALVKLLDAELAVIDGDDHAFYAQFNKTAHLKHVVVVWENDEPVACGALRELEPGVMEVKRMYTLPSVRGKGIATQVLKELENWARELSFTKTRLETGKRQPDAIALYTRNGYRSIPNYGQYASDYNSVCFEKELS